MTAETADTQPREPVPWIAVQASIFVPDLRLMGACLEAEGIPCMIENQHAAAWTFGETGPARLLVPEDRVDEAQELLIARGHLRAAGKPRCPACGSEEIRSAIPFGGWIWPLVLVSLGLVFLWLAVMHPDKACDDCGARFRRSA